MTRDADGSPQAPAPTPDAPALPEDIIQGLADAWAEILRASLEKHPPRAERG
jgi:hypothetical protein